MQPRKTSANPARPETLSPVGTGSACECKGEQLQALTWETKNAKMRHESIHVENTEHTQHSYAVRTREEEMNTLAGAEDIERPCLDSKKSQVVWKNHAKQNPKKALKSDTQNILTTSGFQKIAVVEDEISTQNCTAEKEGSIRDVQR